MISINRIFLFYIMITVQHGWAKKIHLTDKEYAKMPRVGSIENYGRCFQEPDDMYCHLQFMLDSNKPSQLLNLLKNYSVPFVTRYNHLKINRGVCVSRTCAKYIGNSAIQDLDEDTFKSALQACMNESIWREYGLEANLHKIRHCESTKDLDPKELTEAQKLVALAFIFIIILNLMGSYYRNYITKRNNTKANKFLMAFSIQENTRKVLFGTEKEADNFAPLVGMRFIAIIIVNYVHTAFMASFNAENERFYEDVYDQPMRAFVANGTSLIELFFVISGFLLANSYLKSQSKDKFSIRYFLRATFNRYLRVTPTWAAVLALICTWTPKIGSGVMWHELVEAESLDCKENWWRLILYIGNFASFDNEYCMHHTWFLAANMQVYLLSLIFMMIVVKFPKVRRFLFTTAMIASMAVPSAIIFRNKLLPIFVFSPELRRLSLGYSPHFTKVYVTFFAHSTAGIVGLIAGWAHYEIQQKGIDIRSWKVFNFFYSSSLISAVLIVYSGTYFYRENYVYEPILAAIYGALFRLMLSVVLAILVLGAVNGCGSKMRALFSSTPLQILGRLSFSAYLVHMLPLRQYFGLNTAPYYVSLYRLSIVTIGSLTMTYIIAFFFSTFVENPVNELRSALSESSKKEEKKVKTK